MSSKIKHLSSILAPVSLGELIDKIEQKTFDCVEKSIFLRFLHGDGKSVPRETYVKATHQNPSYIGIILLT